jgi:hypothetical protein
VFVYAREIVEGVRQLHASGLNASEVARLTGIPRSTIRHWISERRRASPERTPHDLAARNRRAYAYLLGIYLGDGWIQSFPRTYRLNVFLDARYPRIVGEVKEAMRAMLHGQVVDVRRRTPTNCMVVRAYSRHWPALFPQHGPGMKHTREIELIEWQRGITHAHLDAFIRGLIHSDGCRIVANQRAGGRIYRYERYLFSNRSEDIKRIFCEHLGLLGVEWNRPNDMTIQISRRRSVAALDRFIGPKR